jgi:hypothetical protein
VKELRNIARDDRAGFDYMVQIAHLDPLNCIDIDETACNRDSFVEKKLGFENIKLEIEGNITKMILEMITKPILALLDTLTSIIPGDFGKKINDEIKKGILQRDSELNEKQVISDLEDYYNVDILFITDVIEKEESLKKFIKLLEEYYSYTLYHKKINKISTLNTTHLIIQSKYNIHNDSNDNDMMSSSSILTGESYIINNTIINSINTNNIDKLTQYNDIIMQLTGKNSKEIKKDTKLIEEIKLYLNKNEKEKLNKQIEESKSHQDTYINYIVSRLPIV